MSDTKEIDELDELLGLLDEEEETEVKEQETHKIELQKKTKYESELFVYPHCKIRIDPSSRAITTDELKLRLRRMKFVSLINLPLKLHNKSIISSLVIIGILASKMIRNSKNGNKYLLIKLDDFKASISCFIFNAEIIEKFYKIQEGTVLCIAAPHILEERKQNKNNNISHNIHSDNISLKIERFEQILIVGKAMDFGFCNKSINDGRSLCRNVVNKAICDLCQFHKAKLYKKYASKRNDTNRTSLSKLRNRNKKKCLSGSMNAMKNGISMRKVKTVRTKAVNHENNRKKNRNILLSSSAMTDKTRSRMKKYSNGNKNILQIKQNEKKKELNKILLGKTLMPHLGSNWNKNGKMNGIILTPKCVQNSQNKAQQIMKNKGIILKDPDPNDTTNIIQQNKRKRSFGVMMNNTVDTNDGNAKKKRKVNRLGDIVDTKNMDDIMNMKSLNDNLRNEMDKENVYGHLDDLEEEEKLHDELEEVTSVQISVYICKFQGCPLKDKIHEKPNCFCKAHQANIVKTFGRKYFWKCSVCNNKTNTLNTKRIKSKCNKCGRRKFVSASAYNLTKPKTNTETLIIKNNKK